MRPLFIIWFLNPLITMHTDARNLDNNSLIEGDICIIGAGAAGISMAMEWNNTPFKVILLEGGGLEYEDRIQELYRGKTTGQKYYPLKSTRLHYFGGTTGHWAGYCSLLDPIDFTKRDWINESGWPINLDDLLPFYKKAQDYLDLGPFEYSEDYWLKIKSSFEKLPFDEKIVWNKVWQFSPPTRFGKKFRDPVFNSKNIYLYTYANAVNIVANEEVTVIKEVVVKNYAGRTHIVRAKKIILACNSIQNPRLLLASNQQAKNGLGNDNDIVGRYFMEHLEMKSAELWLNKPYSLNFYTHNPEARCELSITAEKQAEYKILNGTASLSKLSMARRMKPFIETWSEDDPRQSKKRMNEAYDKAEGNRFERKTETFSDTFELYTRIEQAPNPNCRVTLDKEKDELGMPRTQLHWELSSLEKKSIRKLYELIGQQVGLAGIGRIKLLEFLQDENDESWPPFTSGGWHHIGTTRMSNDPKKGVVDANCKVHDIANLYIAGDSCYPTSGAVNPTFSLVALSLRLSNHLLDEMKNNIV
jgi:choline dehydrogenase-like flavoprotein